MAHGSHGKKSHGSHGSHGGLAAGLESALKGSGFLFALSLLFLLH